MATIKLTSIVLCITMWTTMPGDASSFFLDTQKCLAFPPCVCVGGNVFCDSRNLQHFPKFEVSNFTGNSIRLYLQNNQITTIPENAFINLTVSNNTNVDLHLLNNQLNSIATNAFNGMTDAIVTLNLNSNNFTTIPSELQSLSNLQILDLQNNPIASLKPTSTLHELGKHLQSLRIDLNHFNAWPTELELLTSLTELNVRYLTMTQLDVHVFDAFINTLNTLSIQYTQLESFPVAVCNLNNLRYLTFSNNNNRHGTVLELCTNNLTSSITTVDLRQNHLRYMPDVFTSFPSMTTLNIYFNQLSFIPWDIVATNHTLTFLQASNNDFTRIPSAINKLNYLETLWIQSNKITSIEESDLNGLSSLQSLILNGNPIEYISPQAFKNNIVLSDLELAGTKLRHLPSSVVGLHNLRNLYLSGSPIECHCDMIFLKPLNVSGISIKGNCRTRHIPVITYLKDYLPICP